jgi:iron complex outermembrane receptor protein
MVTLRNSVLLLRRVFSLILLFSISVGFTWAQQKTITGKVASETEGPLIGASVVVQGTTTGTTTDIDGNFTITVPGPEAVLMISYIGYTTQTVTVGSQTSINIFLAPVLSALGEIVVTGYGTQKKQEITSSISSVKSDEFNRGNLSTPEQLIVGKVAGLAISKAGGDPNGGYNIRHRGLSTIEFKYLLWSL